MRRYRVMLLLGLLLAGWAASTAGQDAAPPLRVLVVDGTRTFLSTMRVGALVGAMRQIGMFEVDVRLSDVQGEFEDPLAGETLGAGTRPYSAVIIIPRGIDTGTASRIWIVRNALVAIPPPAAAALSLIGQIADQAFAPAVVAIGPEDDLLAGFLWALYVKEGWIHE